MTAQTRVEKEIRILETLRIVNPVLMFGITLYIFGWNMKLPLVLAVTLACLIAIFAFTVVSFILAKKRKQQ